MEEQERNDAGKRLLGIREALAKLNAAHATLAEQRRALFGDTNADAAEQAGEARVSHAELEHKQNLLRLEAARKKKDDCSTRLAMLQKRLAERAATLSAEEQALKEKLATAGFNSLHHCLESCLSDTERKTLEERDRAFNERKTSLRTRLEDNERRRAELPNLPRRRKKNSGIRLKP